MKKTCFAHLDVGCQRRDETPYPSTRNAMIGKYASMLTHYIYGWSFATTGFYIHFSAAAQFLM